MEDNMAPPHKRRRLSNSIVTPSPSRTSYTTIEPTPTFAHEVQHLDNAKLPPTVARPVPQHIQEIHLQIQERAVTPPRDSTHRNHRRQYIDSSITLTSLITTVDAAGNTILSTVTNVLPTVITPTTATTTSASNTASGITGTGTGTAVSNTNSTSISGTQSGTSQTSSGTAQLTNHNNATATHSSTGSHLKSVFLATLTNGNVKTVTRSDKPYVTTFADGQTSTICDTHGDCRMSTQTSNEQSTFAQSLTSSNAQGAFTSTAYAGVGGTSSPSPSSTSPATNNDNNTTPPAGTIAGGVVGGAAGLAVILLIALIFLRWYKRRKQLGHQALPPSSAVSPDDDNPYSTRGPGMAERAGLMPFVAAVPALFRHSNRSQTDSPAPSERGFTRVSGRKLPSQFSEGMSGPPAAPDMPLAAAAAVPASSSQERNLSSTSFYRDSHGFYGGKGTSARGPTPSSGPAVFEGASVGSADHPEESPERGSPSPEGPMEIALSPGPRRTPTIHTGGPYVMSPGSSAPGTPVQPRSAGGLPPPVPALPARSETPTSFADNRSSRFTEEV